MASFVNEEVARQLNDLTALNLRGIAPDESLLSLINDFFGSRDDEEDDNEATASVTEVSSQLNEDDQVLFTPGPECRYLSDRAVDLTGDPRFDNDYDEFEEQAFTEDISEMVAPVMNRGHGVVRDDEEQHQICCKLNKGRPCHTQFSDEVISDLRLNHLALSREELDICILAKLSTGMHLGEQSCHARKTKDRKGFRTDFYLHGQSICRTFFKWLHNIGQDKLNALMAHYRIRGIEARQHKSCKQAPKNAFSFSDTKAVVDFIVNFAEVHAIMLPGRQPGHWKTNVKLLPTNVTKRKVYDAYCASAAVSGIRIVSIKSFYRLWRQLTPFISTMRPATDLCWFCQKNSVHLMRSANLPDSEKSRTVLEAQTHLEKASSERSYYRQVCEAAKNNLPDGVSIGPNFRSSCSFDGMMHYSFDFAQQVHYPSNPLQPGPIFFKTPRKCGLFCVACEALPFQVNFLLEECVSAGKGANCVVSLLHFFLEKYGIGENHVHFHADNCCGQNKNNCMMQYLMWRVLTGRHLSIKMSFLLTGHTKFSCDWLFGLVKKKFKVTKVDCLDDLAGVVNDSATCNTAQLCGTEEGEVLVPVYNWTSYLKDFFRMIKGIKKFHHFHFQQGSGTVECREFLDSEPVAFKLINDICRIDKNVMPTVIPPTGLDVARQWYLYEEIRAFVSDHCKDKVAPKPLIPKGSLSSLGDIEEEGELEEGPSHPKQAKGSKSRGRGRGGRKGKS